jgi:hypothetical protein
MSVLDPKQLQESLVWRYATKKFDSSKRIPSDVWKALEASLVQSPPATGCSRTSSSSSPTQNP